MFSEVRNRVKKAGKPPGSAIYTGDISIPTTITVISISSRGFEEKLGTSFEECFPIDKDVETIWVNVEGLKDSALIKNIANYFKLHPLTVEDILNVQQRPKVEEFDHYIFITLKVLTLQKKQSTIASKQFSIILGKNYVISFQEIDTTLLDTIRNRLRTQGAYHNRFQNADYLMYRFIDIIVDEYFVVLEAVGDKIENLEQNIVFKPLKQKTSAIYNIKRQALVLRKAIWPLREVVNRLLHIEEGLISKFASLYLRDVYDHAVQGIDTVETFRDMLSSMLDMYLSSLTNRMNEIMKTLTIISTIFIPITAIASIYGMNFTYMPGLTWPHGFFAVISVMIVITILMLIYFWRKKWL